MLHFDWSKNNTHAHDIIINDSGVFRGQQAIVVDCTAYRTVDIAILSYVV